MALPLPDYGDASQTRELAEREHVYQDDHVRPSALIWLGLVGALVVIALIVRAMF
jgi:hypothetical protein